MANPAADFPGAVHTAVDISAYSTSGLGTTPNTHSQVHGKIEQEMNATQSKLGAGSSIIPPVGGFLQGVAAGSTAWSAANSINIKGSGIAFTASGGTNVIAYLDNGGNLYISGNYLQF